MIDVELLPRKTAWEAHGKQSEKNLIAPGLYCIARARASDDLVLHGGQDRGGLVLRQRRKADGEAPPAFGQAWAWLVGACAIAALALLWWLYRRPYVALLLRARQHQRAKAHGKRSERWK